MHIKFTFIFLSEIWGNSDTIALYNIAGYTHLYETRDNKIGGMVSIYIMKTISFKIIKDKSVFQSKCNVIVGALYKPPSLSIDIFNKQLERALNVIQKEEKICLLHWWLQHRYKNRIPNCIKTYRIIYKFIIILFIWKVDYSTNTWNRVIKYTNW